MPVDRLHLLQRPEHVGVGVAFHGEEVVDAVHDVVGRQLAPVVELDPLVQMERPHRALRVRLPRLRELRLRLEVLVDAREVREDRLRQHVAVAGRGVRGIESWLHARHGELQDAAALLRRRGRDGAHERRDDGDDDSERLEHQRPPGPTDRRAWTG